MSDRAKEREIEKADRQIERKKTAWVNARTNKWTNRVHTKTTANLFELMDVYIIYIMTCKQISRVVLLCISPLYQSTAFMTA